jgi:hypothetical protein
MMEIKVMKLTDVVPYENNPRKNDQAVDAVMESIKQCGYVAPIIVDENHIILAGHTRYKALKKLGKKEAEVIIRSGLSDEQKRKYRILDNKTSEFAEWDFEKLESEIADLDFSDFSFDLIDNSDAADGADSADGADAADPVDRAGNLAKKFLIPPFSVLYGSKGEWLKRKKTWLEMGIKSEIGRGGELVFQLPGWMERQSSLTRGRK